MIQCVVNFGLLMCQDRAALITAEAEENFYAQRDLLDMLAEYEAIALL